MAADESIEDDVAAEEETVAVGAAVEATHEEDTVEANQENIALGVPEGAAVAADEVATGRCVLLHMW
jgi:hypothetical protein